MRNANFDAMSRNLWTSLVFFCHPLMALYMHVLFQRCMKERSDCTLPSVCCQVDQHAHSRPLLQRVTTLRKRHPVAVMSAHLLHARHMMALNHLKATFFMIAAFCFMTKEYLLQVAHDRPRTPVIHRESVFLPQNRSLRISCIVPHHLFIARCTVMFPHRDTIARPIFAVRTCVLQQLQLFQRLSYAHRITAFDAFL